MAKKVISISPSEATMSFVEEFKERNGMVTTTASVERIVHLFKALMEELTDDGELITVRNGEIVRFKIIF